MSDPQQSRFTFLRKNPPQKLFGPLDAESLPGQWKSGLLLMVLNGTTPKEQVPGNYRLEAELKRHCREGSLTVRECGDLFARLYVGPREGGWSSIFVEQAVEIEDYLLARLGGLPNAILVLKDYGIEYKEPTRPKSETLAKLEALEEVETTPSNGEEPVPVEALVGEGG